MNIEQVCKFFLVAATKFYFKRDLFVYQINPPKNMNPGKKYEGVKKKKKNIVQGRWEVPVVGHAKWLRVHEILLRRKNHEKQDIL